MKLNDLMQQPQVQAELQKLVKEIGELAAAPDAATREKELLDILSQAIETGLVVGAEAAKNTSAIWDDIAVNAARAAGLPQILRALIASN